jgi:hypothetical protein
MPRAKLNPTAEQRLEVRKLASFGMKHEQICAILNLASVTTLHRYFRKDLASGRLNAAVRVRGTLFKLATSGKDAGMTMFYLKTRARWSTQMQLEDVSSRRSPWEPMTWELHTRKPERPPDTLDSEWSEDRADLDDPWSPEPEAQGQ